MKKPIGIVDIAAASKVSPTTVARVINNNGYVSKQKREAVEKAIQDLGYIPNKVASGLRTNRSNLIGHVLPVSSENPFFARICAALEFSAEKAGFNVLTAITQLNPEMENQMVQRLAGMMVEAIIFTTEITSDDRTISWLLSRGIHVVMIERPLQVENIDVIWLDSYAGSALAAEHLIHRGHRSIGFIGRACTNRAVEFQRYNGFTETLTNHGLPICENWISFQEDYHVEYGRRAMQALINAGPLPSALYIASDVMACGVLQTLYQNRIRVPEDISIISCDNTLSSQTSPLLTSIDMRQEDAGTAAIEMIVERKQKKQTGANTVTLSPVLVDRGSVATL